MNKEVSKKKPFIKTAEDKDLEHILVLLNDEVHTFEYVIDALIEICGHTNEQAAQCTMITHYKGKCDIKKGPLTRMTNLRHALLARELKTIVHPSFTS
ncbi:MAG: ATP-dependent Clp protease adaptor ClpS [Prolixibacteraceae bacterium]|nr:ATP-dependent Clp protease adaptor ClpS [Prolixibacteraceae bacterium]